MTPEPCAGPTSSSRYVCGPGPGSVIAHSTALASSLTVQAESSGAATPVMAQPLETAMSSVASVPSRPVTVRVTCLPAVRGGVVEAEVVGADELGVGVGVD